MNCADFRLMIVSDDRADRELLEKHAAGCRDCARIMEGHGGLSQQVESWRRSSPEPPPELEARILEAIGQEALRHRPAILPGQQPGPSAGRMVWFARRRSLAWGALAASTLLAALVLFRASTGAVAPDQADRLLIAAALEEAIAAERAHARAIARLEEAAAPVLARAGDPEVAPNYAAILFAYRDRLAFLDDTIAEIQGFLDDNLSHPGARTMLLAAYTEKTEVLRELLALAKEQAS